MAAAAAAMGFSTQRTTTPFKRRSSFAPNTYLWLCPRSFSSSHSFRISFSPKACHRGEDCKTMSANNSLSSLARLGRSCQIKQTLRHEIKPFSSGITQRIGEDNVAAHSSWGAAAEAIRQERQHNGSYHNVADLHLAECTYYSSDISSKNERPDVGRNAKRSLMLEHATPGPKPYFNHYSQSLVQTSQPRSNALKPINKAGGSTLSPNQLLPNVTPPIGLLANKTKEKKMDETFKQDGDVPGQQMKKVDVDFVGSGTLNKTKEKKLLANKTKEKKMDETFKQDEDFPVLQMKKDDVVENGTLNQAKLAECTATEKSIAKVKLHERLESIYDKVFIVDDISVAKEVVCKLTNEYRDFIHACDTEVAKIDVKQETPVGHGEITCFSIYSGPDADFGNGKSCVWVDVLDGGGKDLLVEFAPFFEDPSIKKVWHNYSFDCHIIENYGLKVSGFHADTMHLARLWDSSRRTSGGYSLEALTGDPLVMCDARVSPGKELFGKVSMKTIFGRKKLKKDGTEGKVDIIPSVEELQRTERKLWISYSALDSISTLMLYESLKTKLIKRVWKLDGVNCGSMLGFYKRYWLPFGELLTQMETEGMLVDRAYLADLERVAKAEQEIASKRFRNWASKYCPDAKYMNVGSDAQLRQLFFGGTPNRKDSNECLENKRDFKVLNTENIIEEGKKTPTKYRKIIIHKIGDHIETDLYTASGWPSVSGDALKALAGKISADFEIVSEADDDVEEVSDSSNDEPFVANNEAPCSEPEASGYGTAYNAFGGGKEGREACHAIASLCEICSIDSLISNFILPLQGGDISGKNGRIHCSLNINTETGRLSARRPNLQNQPALEKDRYKIRQAFIAAPGNSLIVADYGQLELRILAHLANCKSMLDAFEAGGDFHSRTALNMYLHIREAVEQKHVLLEWHPQPGEDKPPVPLLKDAFASERRKAKMLNFSIAYGKTTVGLARDWKVSVKEAKETVDRWYSDRQEVLSWQEQRKAEAHLNGCVYTLLGRARKFHSLKKANTFLKGHIERAAINTPVQGSAADVAMSAMLEISRNPRLKELGWKLLLQVHDEVILEGPTESAEEAKAIVVHCMANPFDGKNFLRVGLSVDAKCAQNWYSAK